MLMNNNIITVAIIGGGPAGIACAIQLKRSGIKSIILFDKKDHSSLLLNARLVENYMGFSDGISGIDLWNKFYQQFIKYNIKQIFSYVDLLEFNEQEKLFTIMAKKNIYYAKYIVVASGTKPKTLNVINTDIHYDITKISNQKNQKIAIVGAGDAAFDYALSMSKCNNVSIFNRKHHINALFALQQKVINCNNIQYFNDTKLISIKKNNQKLKLFLKYQNNLFEKKFDYLIIAIGRIANKNFYSSKLHKLETRLIKHKLLYLIGDVHNNIYRQVTIATADGILAAMQLREHLNENYC